MLHHIPGRVTALAHRCRRTVGIVSRTSRGWGAGPPAVLGGAATAAVVLVLVVLGTWGASSTRGTPAPSAVGWGLLGVAAVALMGVQARPLTTLGVIGVLVTAYLATGQSYGPVLVTVGVASYAAARRAPGDRASAVAVAVLVVLWLPLWWRTPVTPVSGASPDGLLGLVPLAAWVVVPFSAGYARRVRAQVAERSRAFVLQERLAVERLRMSQDVHDVVGHGLAAIKMQADVALHVLGGRADLADPGIVALRAIGGSAAAALEELREVLGTLGPTHEETGRAVGAGLGDLTALRERMGSAGLNLRWKSEGDLQALPERVDRAAYRVLQEGLTNVLRHGDTDAPVRVEVRRGPGELRLRVLNRVRVAATQPDFGGVGLPGMRTRVVAVGGWVVAARDGDDFVLEARLPVAGGQR